MYVRGAPEHWSSAPRPDPGSPTDDHSTSGRLVLVIAEWLVHNSHHNCI